MSGPACREQGIAGAAVDFPGQGTAFVTVEEQSQVRAQGPARQPLPVHQVQIALPVDVVQLRMPGTGQGTFVIEAVLDTCVVEAIRTRRGCGPGRQLLHIRRVAQAHLSEMPGVQPQPLDLAGNQRRPPEGLRQEPAIVIAQHGDIGEHLAKLQFAGRNPQLQRRSGATIVPGRTTVVVHR
ncbi:hypothetical protein FQZ97_900310 [compost metagenome]